MNTMTFQTDSILREIPHDPNFPYAPLGWSREDAMQLAEMDHIPLTEDHWEAVCAVQQFYARHEGTNIKMRELHDALDEHFHAEGGIKYLYQLFPAGPIAQCCRLAGLKAPTMATDRSFGSVS